MKYRPLMVLGTGSDVGKSLMVAALCRIMAQDGVRVAPFKAQNMALNSFITPEGGEMGRAQVVQAQAAGLTPHVDMNPILLKPMSAVGSQVIVSGKVYGNFSAAEYYRHKPKLVRRVMASFRRLAGAHDLIILEGAGSAAELNLKAHDLVNFSMAKRAGAAVLLVADIDRGGVFAATIGTHHLLTRTERRLLEGFIINKFRGDISLFAAGTEIIARRTGKPVLGVVPYARDLHLPQEDSVYLDRRGARGGEAGDGQVRIGVVRLPHISNYTDFDPLEQEPGVSLRYVGGGETLEGLDLVILPGTKNTIGDLGWLEQTGLAGRIRDYAGAGGRVIGICGGYQILGQSVRDPLGVEGHTPEAAGLGLLPVTTTMAGDKTTTQVEAAAAGLPGLEGTVAGYEIHMGVSRARGPGRPAFRITRSLGEAADLEDGWAEPTGRVWGTYIHGALDADGFRRALLGELRRERGLAGGEATEHGFAAFQEGQFDALAELVRQHVDVERIKRIVGM